MGFILTLMLAKSTPQVPYTRPVPQSCSNPIKCPGYVAQIPDRSGRGMDRGGRK